jgi:hypothetical protein
MNILSKILVDSYYKLEKKERIPLVMQWDTHGLDHVGVSTSKSRIMISDEPLLTVRSAVFEIKHKEIFDSIVANMTFSPYTSFNKAVKDFEKQALKPTYLIGDAERIRSEFKVPATVTVINHPLSDFIIMTPQPQKLGFFIVVAHAEMKKTYATFIINSPYHNLKAIQWKKK